MPVRFGSGQGDTSIKPVALASLYKEKFRFSSKSGALVGCEGAPQALRLVRGIARVNYAQFAMGQDGHQEAVRV